MGSPLAVLAMGSNPTLRGEEGDEIQTGSACQKRKAGKWEIRQLPEGKRGMVSERGGRLECVPSRENPAGLGLSRGRV